jgi:hypothetical protein
MGHFERISRPQSRLKCTQDLSPMVDFIELLDGAETIGDQIKQTKSDPISKRIRAAKERVNQAKARLARLEQMESKQARRDQSRRHYILGELLLKQAFEAPGVARMALTLINQVSERDKALFAELEARLEAKIATEAPQERSKPVRRTTSRKRKPTPKTS